VISLRSESFSLCTTSILRLLLQRKDGRRRPRAAWFSPSLAGCRWLDLTGLIPSAVHRDPPRRRFPDHVIIEQSESVGSALGAVLLIEPAKSPDAKSDANTRMTEKSTNSRLEAFCDGVFAIALTLLIIDIKIPPSTTINTTNDLWLALGHTAPSVFSFLLSFVVILITWVNHHAALKLVNKTSPQFIYANAVLLLSVVFIPFPTALLGEYIFTDHAAPAVVLYSAVCGFQGIGWFLMTQTSMRPQLLAKNEKSLQAILKNRKYSIFAIAFYAAAAIVAIWLPKIVAIAISLIWVFWIIVGVNLREE